MTLSLSQEFFNRDEVDQAFAGTHKPYEWEGGVGQSYVFLFEFDQDSDQKVSLDEWRAGFAKEAHGPPPGSVLLQGI